MNLLVLRRFQFSFTAQKSQTAAPLLLLLVCCGSGGPTKVYRHNYNGSAYVIFLCVSHEVEDEEEVVEDKWMDGCLVVVVMAAKASAAAEVVEELVRPIDGPAAGAAGLYLSVQRQRLDDARHGMVWWPNHHIFESC